MQIFRFVLVEGAKPQWEREFECPSEAEAVAEGRRLLETQLVVRPAAVLQLSVHRPDGAVIGWWDTAGTFHTGGPPSA